MDSSLDKLTKQPVLGAICLVTVFGGMALGHSLVVLQHSFTGGPTALNTALCAVMGFAGFALVWIGLNKPEAQATVLGYIGGNLIWIGVFEWIWLSFAHWMKVDPIYDRGMMILSPELLIIQATGMIVVAMLIFLGANKDTRCRMFMWFHRNFKLTPGRQTPGYKRQHARTTALETVFLIWSIYQFAILINDPRLIGYDSIPAMVITVGFVIWGIYLATKLFKIRGVGPTLRYAIPTGAILWLPIEAFSRWGMYPEVWIKPSEYTGIMTVTLILFIAAIAGFYRSGQPRVATT